MKKILTVIMIVFITCSTVFAAGQTEVPLKGTTINFWHPYGEGSWTSDYLDQVVKEFNVEYPEITVKLQSYPDYASIIEALQRGVAADTLPSIATIGYGYDRYVLNSGKAVSFDEAMTKAESNAYYSDFFDSALSVTTFDDKVYGIPFALSVPVIFYHTEVFEKAGLDPNSPPKTWKEFVEVSKHIEESVGIAGAAFALDDPWAFECLLRSSNGRFLEDDGTLAIDSPQAVSLLEDWGKGAKENYFLYNSDFFETLMTFGAQQVGMFVVSSYGTLIYRDTAPGVKVAPIPVGSATDRVDAPIGGNAIYLFGNSDAERKAASTFVQFLTSPKMNAEWAMNSGYLPTRTSALESMSSFIEGFDNYKKVVSYIDNLSAPTQWPERHVLKINQILMNAIESVMLQIETADKALEKASNEIAPLL